MKEFIKSVQIARINCNRSVRIMKIALLFIVLSLPAVKAENGLSQRNETGVTALDMNRTVEQQRKQVTGRVVDLYGEPIIGANIVEEGTSNGTVTDIDGNFSITVADDAVLMTG